jgi:starvation-inducible outer membrane lipoprotein
MQAAMKTLLMIVLAVSLAGCVAYPARPAYYRPVVVVY